MGGNMMPAASDVVDLIKTIIRDEGTKQDRIITGTVLSRDADYDTYSIYIETDVGRDGQRTVMNGVPNESKHIYRPGDHVYLMKVRGQMAQGFIIGSIGGSGSSLGAQINDLQSEVDLIKKGTAAAVMLISPKVVVEPFPYKEDPAIPDEDAVFGIRLSWMGCLFPYSVMRILTDLHVGGTDPGHYSNGIIMLSPPMTGTAIMISGATNVFAGSSVSKISIVRASVTSSNERQFVELAFTNAGSPIPFGGVVLGENGVRLEKTARFGIMCDGYDYTYPSAS